MNTRQYVKKCYSGEIFMWDFSTNFSGAGISNKAVKIKLNTLYVFLV